MRSLAEGPTGRGTGWKRAAAVAGLLLAAVAFGWFTFRNGPLSHPKPAAVVEESTGGLEVLIGKGYWRQIFVGEGLPKGIVLRTLQGAEASFRMAGGAVARLGADGRVQFVATDIRLEQGALDVDASGVQPGSPPLEVRTPFGVIRDAGPRFEVRCDQSANPPLRVRVREGSVVYEEPGRSTRVAAGEELAVRHDGAVMRSRVAGFGADWE
ncbi:MAG TPA: FecR family protein [Thermoanaerobaculia bacterium]|nr:FecR family protein [Thermoanaerobaculia bacterium]